MTVMNSVEFPSWPSFSAEEARRVSAVLLSNKINYWTGNEGREFEREFAEYADSKYAVAVGNGTLALDLALTALDIGAGDEVVVTPRTFLASASSIVNAGAIPVFADVDANSGNITAETIEQVLSSKTKAIICVHLAGIPCEMDEIMALAAKHDLLVVEDCAQAHGARYKGRSVGSIGHVGAWSFCQDKIMTTGGEGGMVTTNDKSLWSKMWSYKDHGKSWSAVYETKHPPGFRWLHESFGTNWRLTEMQSAIGRIQIRKMPDWTARRQENAAMLDDALGEFACIQTVRVPDYMEHACYKHYVYIDSRKLKSGWDRDRVVRAIVDHGVPCFQGTCSEVYLEKAFDGTNFRPSKRLVNAKLLGATSLMFLVHPTLSIGDMQTVCDVAVKVLVEASG